MKISCRSYCVSVLVITCNFAWLACKKSPAAPPVNNSATVASLIKSATNLSIFEKALVKTGYDKKLAGAGPFTVFVPADAAFAMSGIDSNVINNYNDSALLALVSYYVLDANYVTANFPLETNGKYITDGNDSIFITKDSSGIFINGNPLTVTDVVTGNGTVQGISTVLFPPRYNCLQTIQSDSGFTFLTAALTLLDSTGATLPGMLSTGGPYTIFAASNNAFRSAGYSDISYINNVNQDSLLRLLQYQVITGRYFTHDLVTLSLVPTLLIGDSLTIGSDAFNNISVKGSNDSTASNLIRQNIMTVNGVIHSVDQLLLP